MRNSICLIVLMFCGLCASAQHITLSDTVGLDLPTGVTKLDKEHYSASMNKNFGNSKVALKSVPLPNERLANKSFYSKDGILINLVHGKRREKSKDTYLADAKKAFDRTFSINGNPNNYLSEIKKINGNTVLILYYEIDGVGYYDFFCNDQTNRFGLNGRLQFKLTDKNEAGQLLNDLLNSIGFTK